MGYIAEVDVSDNRNFYFALRAIGFQYLSHSTRQLFTATREMESFPPFGQMTSCKRACVAVCVFAVSVEPP